MEQRVKERILELKEELESLKNDRECGDVGYCDFDRVDENIERVKTELGILNWVLTGKPSQYMYVV